MILNKKDLERYKDLVPLCDYSNLEMFLRTCPDATLVSIMDAWEDEENIKPFDQFFLFVLMGNIFLNEYGVEEMTREDFVSLMPILMTGIPHEIMCRTDISYRRGYWRELKPSLMEFFKKIIDEEKAA